ncbi:MAG TPA: DnaJ domain-containing protein [Candidatus Paceibacterota bacterium]
MNKDYYKILGVNKDASSGEIKKAFHSLAQKHHPDKSSGDEAKFKEINEAYQVLGNEKKRTEYDTYGQTFSGAGSGAGGAGPGAGFNAQGWDFSGFSNQGGVEFDLGDIFGEFFGGRSRRRASRRGEDITVDLEVPLTDSLLGARRTIRINKFVNCESCKGSGAEVGSDLEKCSVCNGNGAIKQTQHSIFGAINVELPCRECDATGKRPKIKCHTCRGAGIMRMSDEINLDIPQGIEKGEIIKQAGRGEAIRGGPSGDLYVRVHMKMPTKFSKRAREALEELRKEGI